MSRGGAREGAGSPGYGKLEFIKNKVYQYSELWWTEWEKMMNSKPDEFINDNIKEILKELVAKGDKYTVKELIESLAKGAFYRKQFAMAEVNKIQLKMIPQDVTSGGKSLVIKFDKIFDVNTPRTTETSTPESSEV